MKYGYARVSTDKQDLGSQTVKLTEAGVLPEHIYADIGISGSQKSRPGLDELLSILQPGDEVVVFRMDRLGRSLRNMVELADNLHQRGITIASVGEGIRTDQALGRMMMQLFALMAEWERVYIIERINAGVEKAKRFGTKSGRAIGRPRRSGRAVSLALKLIEDGHSHRNAAQIARVSKSSVVRALQREKAAAAA
ncbi:recombinase family protein [Gluconobacter cerinus]|uniref:recombinase family protein n=1 Tax=Gluconobacter cerinus TaxID=38307 RepID=UPI001B8D69FC|nr:recombinase family protein [Gluconobacter cerinus]